MKINRQCVISVSIIMFFIIVFAAVILIRTDTSDKKNVRPDSSVEEQPTIPETKPIETIDAKVETDSITITLISEASDDDIKDLMRDIGAASLAKVNDDTYRAVFKEDHDASELNALVQKALTHAIVDECSLTCAGQ